jgi:hypothetical protein
VRHAVRGGGRLAEVPEEEATGSVAAAYDDIRRVLGLPIVNLIYRHLATRPGRLEETWAALRPSLTSSAAERAAAELVSGAAPPRVDPIPGRALAAVGLAAREAALARATLDAYARANSRNLLGMVALLEGCSGTGGGADAAGPAPSEPILPMADLASLSPDAVALLDEMSLALVGDEEPTIVPSLLRHFAHDPCLLALLWTAARPAVEGGRVSSRARVVARRARVLARGLPHPVAPLVDDEVRTIAGRFTGAMSTMLVLGEVLRTALAEALEPAASGPHCRRSTP